MTASSTLPERILDYLRGKLALGADARLTNLQRIAVGWSHETWLFDLEWQDGGGDHSKPLCVRRDPGNALLRELSDLRTQFRVLECLAPTALPTPTPYWFEDDPAILDAPFIVMEKVRGVCPSPWGRDGRAFYRDAAARGRLPADFTRALATLHTLDWRAAGLGFLGEPAPGEGFVRRELAKWRGLALQSGRPLEPILVDLLGWLETNIPACQRVCLVHGAWRTGNLLIADDRISAVLDWELQVLGDPLYDVAYVLSDLNREGTELLSNLVARDDFVRDYESLTGITIDDAVCRFYDVLYAVRSAAFWMSASGLFADGRSDDLRLARTAWSVSDVLARAARGLGY